MRTNTEKREGNFNPANERRVVDARVHMETTEKLIYFLADFRYFGQNILEFIFQSKDELDSYDSCVTLRTRKIKVVIFAKGKREKFKHAHKLRAFYKMKILWGFVWR